VQPAEIDEFSAALGRRVLGVRTLAGGFSHETALLTFADSQAVVRLGGSDPAVEAAVMAAARQYVPVPEVQLVLAGAERGRPAMVIEYRQGTLLSEVLDSSADCTPAELSELGAEVGRVAAAIGEVTFERPGFFAGRGLAVRHQQPWSQQLAGFAADCMAAAPPGRLDQATANAWTALCGTEADALLAVDEQARLVHADLNPKNLLVARAGAGWRVSALLDWEFSFSGCPYGDAANMIRFGADYPAGFVTGFVDGFAAHQPAELPLPDDWLYLGRVLDMFALSDLVTRPAGHQVADQAAGVIRQWARDGVPRSA
jgi:Ser/Thr protein kinase RdoA (MazF antagonist)